MFSRTCRITVNLAGYEHGNPSAAGEIGLDLDNVYDEDPHGGDADGDRDRDGVPLGKEPQLWEFARDVVTSLVSDLAVVRERWWQ